MGRQLISEKINNSETIVNTQTLISGIYFYSITQNNTTVKSGKLMIE